MTRPTKLDSILDIVEEEEEDEEDEEDVAARRAGQQPNNTTFGKVTRNDRNVEPLPSDSGQDPVLRTRAATASHLCD